MFQQYPYKQEAIKNYQNVLSNDLTVYQNEFKTKSDNKNTANEYRYFLESNFVGVFRSFVLVYSNQDGSAKRFKTQRYYLPKGIIKIITSSSMEKTL